MPRSGAVRARRSRSRTGRRPRRSAPRAPRSARTRARARRSRRSRTSRRPRASGARPAGARSSRASRGRARKVQRGHRREREAKQIKKLVGFDPRERYGYTPRKTKYNVMPAPKGLKKASEARLPGDRPEEAQGRRVQRRPGWPRRSSARRSTRSSTASSRPSTERRGTHRHAELTGQARRSTPSRRGEEVGRAEVPDAAERARGEAREGNAASSTSTWPSTRARSTSTRVTSALMLLPGRARARRSPPGGPRASPGKQTLAPPRRCAEGHRRCVQQRPAAVTGTVRALQAHDRRAAQTAKPGKRGSRSGAGWRRPRRRSGVRAPRGRQMLETTGGGARRSGVQQRVDEFRDVAQHTRNEVFKKHAKAAQKKAKGKSKTERAATSPRNARRPSRRLTPRSAPGSSRSSARPGGCRSISARSRRRRSSVSSPGGEEGSEGHGRGGGAAAG